MVWFALFFVFLHPDFGLRTKLLLKYEEIYSITDAVAARSYTCSS